MNDDKVEEKITIEISEEGEGRSNESSEIVVELNTMTENTAEITQPFRGKLKAMIIELDKQAKIEVFFKQWPSIKILDLDAYRAGVTYFILKTDAFNAEGERFNFGAEEWILNDEIVFKISGSVQTRAKFTMRMD